MLGVRGEPEAWLGALYQSANRYAHLYWLREKGGVEPWLVHLLFTDDHTHRPATREEWEKALPAVERDLRLDEREVRWAGHAFLPAPPLLARRWRSCRGERARASPRKSTGVPQRNPEDDLALLLAPVSRSRR